MLHIAVKNGSYPIVNCLVKAGADVNAQDVINIYNKGSTMETRPRTTLIVIGTIQFLTYCWLQELLRMFRTMKDLLCGRQMKPKLISKNLNVENRP